MKKLFFFFTGLYIISCNAQPTVANYKNSLSNSTILNTAFTTKNGVKKSITYPSNLPVEFQNIINKYVEEDLKRENCDGPDAETSIKYDVKYNGINVLCILKITEDVYCSIRDNTYYEAINLYKYNNSTYQISLVETNTEVINVATNFISTADPNCDYIYQDCLKYITLSNNKKTKLFLASSVVCIKELDFDLQEGMIVFNKIL